MTTDGELSASTASEARPVVREGLTGEILLPGDEGEQRRQESRVRRGFLGLVRTSTLLESV